MSPESTRTSSTSPSACRALRTASPGSARRLLHRDPNAVERVRGRRRGDDDERVGLELTRRPQHPVHDPATEQGVEVLRSGRAHARAETGRHDDRAEPRVVHLGHRGWGARIRTWDHGTKTRCLTTWPRPRARSSCQCHRGCDVDDRSGDPAASGPLERGRRERGRFRSLEQPVHDRAGAGHVGAKRAEPLQFADEQATTRGRSAGARPDPRSWSARRARGGAASGAPRNLCHRRARRSGGRPPRSTPCARRRAARAGPRSPSGGRAARDRYRRRCRAAGRRTGRTARPHP